MAEFLVKRTGPARVTLVIPTDKGRACVHLTPEKHGAGRRLSVPDEHADKIDPRHARHLVRLNKPAPADDEPELDVEEHPTTPATPDSIRHAAKIEV
jgi:hypothetical protein